MSGNTKFSILESQLNPWKLRIKWNQREFEPKELDKLLVDHEYHQAYFIICATSSDVLEPIFREWRQSRFSKPAGSKRTKPNQPVWAKNWLSSIVEFSTDAQITQKPFEQDQNGTVRHPNHVFRPIQPSLDPDQVGYRSRRRGVCF